MTERFICVECNRAFTLSHEEQRSFLERGLSLPKRCPACLAQRRREREAGQPPTARPAPADRRRPSTFTPRPAKPVLPRLHQEPTRTWWANPFARFGWLSLGLGLMVSLGLVLWLGFSGWGLLIAWLMAINVITLAVYRYDKFIAGGERTRVPEMILLGLALIGGVPGAYTGMYLFRSRHKTRKAGFVIMFWSIVALQVTALCGCLIWLGYL